MTFVFPTFTYINRQGVCYSIALTELSFSWTWVELQILPVWRDESDSYINASDKRSLIGFNLHWEAGPIVWFKLAYRNIIGIPLS